MLFLNDTDVLLYSLYIKSDKSKACVELYDGIVVFAKDDEFLSLGTLMSE
jgi:hypothetical protein